MAFPCAESIYLYWLYAILTLTGPHLPKAFVSIRTRAWPSPTEKDSFQFVSFTIPQSRRSPLADIGIIEKP